mmetsp:Transcript_39993/g.81799  ORF Transcript_39993/g.81799 Transcript_39993/m.81799 type:complete len:148 (+) Transcript_39993:70-513(+)|eukprot:CAMPEP_0171461614 /NCGR_PEP_ID=MMETSP0945-20130129/5988_1 /TAXON_ID=109269 /ORGANISM="Vaucheria litorea, Strain CCMP2940" /LENGTH=147 /DNA_ID=CAMNT_0011987989 /DNA_START=34 /DNA_END=477 /DNA_ORIENTATION=+
MAKGAAAKARNTSRKVRHGTHNKVVTVRTKTHFYKPKTLALPRNPKVVRKSVRKTEAGLQRMDKYNIIRYPLTTESAMKKIEDNNTLVFIVDKLANKRQIKSAVRGMYEIECEKVNTLIRPDGLKKAYVRLTGDYDALEVANRIGII